jgi:uncharacterized protein YcgI (DUF1989 family)
MVYSLFFLLNSVNQMLTGEGFDFHCHSNLTRAILPYHLTEFDVHDVLNVVEQCNLFAKYGSFSALDSIRRTNTS